MTKTQSLPLGLFLLVNSQEVCVVTNGAMRFGCVVPFGTTHFFILRRKRKMSIEAAVYSNNFNLWSHIRINNMDGVAYNCTCKCTS